MKVENFNQVINRRCDLIKQVLAIKGEEYARGDAFSQLKEVAAMVSADTSPEQACWVALSKHLVSVRALITDASKGSVVNRIVFAEKIGDAINYLIILEGLLEERISGEPVAR